MPSFYGWNNVTYTLSHRKLLDIGGHVHVNSSYTLFAECNTYQPLDLQGQCRQRNIQGHICVVKKNMSLDSRQLTHTAYKFFDL